MKKRVMVGIYVLSAAIITVLLLSVALVFANYENNAQLKTLREESAGSQKISISRELADRLNDEYEKGNKEFAACLDVRQITSYSDSNAPNTAYTSYLIEGFDGGITFYGEDYSTTDYCENGAIHSHPKGNCFFSVADIYSFKDRIKRGEYVSVLMCGEDEFYYITRNDFSERPLMIT